SGSKCCGCRTPTGSRPTGSRCEDDRGCRSTRADSRSAGARLSHHADASGSMPGSALSTTFSPGFERPFLVGRAIWGCTLLTLVLSFSVAVAQSYWTVSFDETRYQNDSLLALDGAVNVCAIELSPLVGLLLPTEAADEPPCVVVLTDVAPADVQPPSVPVSKSP